MAASCGLFLANHLLLGYNVETQAVDDLPFSRNHHCGGIVNTELSLKLTGDSQDHLERALHGFLARGCGNGQILSELECAEGSIVEAEFRFVGTDDFMLEVRHNSEVVATCLIKESGITDMHRELKDITHMSEDTAHEFRRARRQHANKIISMLIDLCQSGFHPGRVEDRCFIRRENGNFEEFKAEEETEGRSHTHETDTVLSTHV